MSTNLNFDNHIKIDVKCCTVSIADEEKIANQFLPSGYKNLPVVRSLAGVVKETGQGTGRFKVGDSVVGILPIDCAKTIEEISNCHLEEYLFVLKPDELSFEIATCCIFDGVTAYTALHYQGKVRPGDTVVICNGADSQGVLLAQLALNWGAKVLVTTADDDNAQRLRMMLNKGPHIFGGHQLLRNLIMDETGGLGVDCIIDNGVIVYESLVTNSLEKDFSKPTKHDIISCLAPGGRWVTRQHDLQIDPPDSKVLFLKGASVNYLFPEVWLLSTFQQGRYLHILNDVLLKAAEGIIRPHLMTVLPASELQTRADIFSTDNCIVLKL